MNEEVYKCLIKLLEKMPTEKVFFSPIRRSDLLLKYPSSVVDEIIKTLQMYGIATVYYEGNRKIIKLSQKCIEYLKNEK